MELGEKVFYTGSSETNSSGGKKLTVGRGRREVKGEPADHDKWFAREATKYQFPGNEGRQPASSPRSAAGEKVFRRRRCRGYTVGEKVYYTGVRARDEQGGEEAQSHGHGIRGGG